MIMAHCDSYINWKFLASSPVLTLSSIRLLFSNSLLMTPISSWGEFGLMNFPFFVLLPCSVVRIISGILGAVTSYRDLWLFVLFKSTFTPSPTLVIIILISCWFLAVTLRKRFLARKNAFSWVIWWLLSIYFFWLSANFTQIFVLNSDFFFPWHWLTLIVKTMIAIHVIFSLWINPWN